MDTKAGFIYIIQFCIVILGIKSIWHKKSKQKEKPFYI